MQEANQHARQLVVRETLSGVLRGQQNVRLVHGSVAGSSRFRQRL
jgi:hypothetical protein